MAENTNKSHGRVKKMHAKLFNPYYLVKTAEDYRLESERAMKNGVNGPVVTYFLPLDEVWERWGKPGDLMGYEPMPQLGSRIR